MATYLLRLLSDPSSVATDEIHLESKLQSCLSRNMAENTLTSDGFITITKEQELINETDDMLTDDFTKEDVQEKINSSNTQGSFKHHSGLNFFQALISQLLKLCV